MSKKITWQEVAENQKNGWMVIEGVVYNPTEYLNEHPGGPAVLQNRYGKDASRDFNETGHTSGARDKMKAYQVGVIDPASQPEKWQSGGGTPANAQQFAFFVVALVAVFIIYQFFKN